MQAQAAREERSMLLQGDAPEDAPLFTTSLRASGAGRARRVGLGRIATRPPGRRREATMATCSQSLVPRRILCATDFSANSAAALQVASVLARSCGAEVRVLHVAPMAAERLVLDNETRAEIDRRLESFTDPTVTPALAVRRVRREGDPCAEIGREVRDEEADLVVMGRHSHSPELARNSITEGVARQSPCPIMVVESGGGDFQPRRLLCALDLGETSRKTLAHAEALTSALGADLLVLHVVAALDHAAASPAKSALCISPAEERASRGLSNFVAETGLPSRRVRQRIVSGEPVPAILDAGREDQIDLMVVGLHAGGLVGWQFLGSTTIHLLRHADCALLLVPAPVLVQDEAFDDESECVVVGRPPVSPSRLGRYGADPDSRGMVTADRGASLRDPSADPSGLTRAREFRPPRRPGCLIACDLEPG